MSAAFSRRPRHREGPRQTQGVPWTPGIQNEHSRPTPRNPSASSRHSGGSGALTDPSLHQATYQFADEASLVRAMKGADLNRLVDDFNSDWPDVTRTRETLVLAEEFAA